MEKNLPEWLYFDPKLILFKGKVPEDEEENVTYEIHSIGIVGSNEVMADMFLIEVYSKRILLKFETIKSIDLNESIERMGVIERYGKMYLLVFYNVGIKIVDNSDVENPILKVP